MHRGIVLGEGAAVWLLYYYANWIVWNDVDVRVAFVSPYQSIASTYRWLRSVDVR